MNTPSNPKTIISLIGSEINGIPLSEMNHFQKSQFLKSHCNTILDYAELFGDDSCLEKFAINTHKLKWLRDYSNNTSTRSVDIALKTIADYESRVSHLEVKYESVVTLRREVRELKELFASFAESTAAQVGRGILLPLFKALIEQYGGKWPDDGDPLSIEKILPPEFKRQQRQKALKDNPLLETIEKINHNGYNGL